MEFSRELPLIMGPLPIDLISDILARLPIKCLIRSKVVCKSWHALISSSNFINLHLYINSLPTSNKLLIFSTNDHSLYSTIFDGSPNYKSPANEVNFLEDLRVSSIVGSCNGLLLCLSSNSEPFLVNPSLHQYTKILNLKVPRNYLYVNYGLGYDFKANDYKVVRIVNFVCGCDGGPVYNAREVMVYSLRANSWKFVEQKICDYVTLASRKGALVNNHLLHWMFWCISTNDHRILSFDVCSDTWGEIPLPNYVESGVTKLLGCDNDELKLDVVDLGVLDGCLCLLTRNFRTHMSDNVWVMKKYGVMNSWVRLFNISDLDVIRSLKIAPIAYSNNGREILLRKDEESNVFWYDLSDKSATSVEFCGLPDYCGMSICSQSLVPLVGYCKIDR